MNMHVIHAARFHILYSYWTWFLARRLVLADRTRTKVWKPPMGGLWHVLVGRVYVGAQPAHKRRTVQKVNVSQSTTSRALQSIDFVGIVGMKIELGYHKHQAVWWWIFHWAQGCHAVPSLPCARLKCRHQPVRILHRGYFRTPLVW